MGWILTAEQVAECRKKFHIGHYGSETKLCDSHEAIRSELALARQDAIRLNALIVESSALADTRIEALMDEVDKARVEIERLKNICTYPACGCGNGYCDKLCRHSNGGSNYNQNREFADSKEQQSRIAKPEKERDAAQLHQQESDARISSQREEIKKLTSDRDTAINRTHLNVKMREAAEAERDSEVFLNRHHTANLLQYGALIQKIQAIVHEFHGKGERMSDFDVLDQGVWLIAEAHKAAIAERDGLRRAIEAAPHGADCSIGSMGCHAKNCFDSVGPSDTVWFLGHRDGEAMLSCSEHKDDVFKYGPVKCDCWKSRALAAVPASEDLK